jgi:putative FmdB family regulatory protein
MTYEYLCTACGHQWEADQSITAAPLKQCPACKKNKAQRQVSGGAGFVLKGGGWYADLYSSAKPKPAGDKDGSSKVDAGESKSKEGKSTDKSASTPPKKNDTKATSDA